MATRRRIRGALGNFLGTYVSRYSDYEGYWLFGFLVGQFEELQIDLLAPSIPEPGSPRHLAVESAAAKFDDQLRKAGLARSRVREAWVTIRRLPEPVMDSINGHTCAGYNLRFTAGAVMDGGGRYEREKVLFVAPHNAGVERRSARSAQPSSTRPSTQ